MRAGPMKTEVPSNSRSTIKPELLAPAGDHDCLRAAIENGADAVYFGLQAFNARIRAHNFGPHELPELMATLHQRGVKGYITLNTLMFPAEIDELERIVRTVAEAGVDAIIVQDLGLCRLIRAITPDVDIHASTQMTITSVEGVQMAQELGCSRVILARELSLRDIAAIVRESPLPVEVFVHGAICVAYSGQCLTSEALGGRSANRGECAQACRMPYELVCDGRQVDLGDRSYLLSPQDLAAHELLPELVNCGVSAFKIEGRLKSAEYVATATRHYRRALDAAWENRPSPVAPSDVQDLALTFSRGFCHGFLDGDDHKALVRGDHAKKRGILLGTVSRVLDKRVRIEPLVPVKPGDGVVFDGDESAGLPEQGGRVYEAVPASRMPRSEGALKSSRAESGTQIDLAFGNRDVNLSLVRPGQRIWKTDDAEVDRRARASFEGPPRRTVGIDVRARAIAGEPLVIAARTDTGLESEVRSETPLQSAERHPATLEELREQFDRLGGTGYDLRDFQAHVAGGPLVPRSVLNTLRRDLVTQLDARAAEPPPRVLAPGPVAPALRVPLSRDSAPSPQPAPTRGEGVRDTISAPSISALCRNLEQALAALEAGAHTIYLDFHAIKTYPEAVSVLKERDTTVPIFLAPPRIQKPGEANLFRVLAKAGADGLLVRNAGGLTFCAAEGIPFVADATVNAANELTVGFWKARGALRVTASHDLSFEQIDDLLSAAPPDWLEIVVYHHMPMFHMEHCVYCAFLSPGTNKTNCGRPCDRHEVKLRDRVGMEHPLGADVGCRNTLFNAVPQTAAEFLPRLMVKGAAYFRIEFLNDSADAVTRILTLHSEAIAGRREPRTLWKELKATNRFGVTRGQLAIL